MRLLVSLRILSPSWRPPKTDLTSLRIPPKAYPVRLSASLRTPPAPPHSLRIPGPTFS
jgi:hypothetical protein